MSNSCPRDPISRQRKTEGYRDNLGLIYIQTHQDNTNKAVCVLTCGCIDAFVVDHVENRKLLKNTAVCVLRFVHLFSLKGVFVSHCGVCTPVDT
jgi:hypothetical protein